jgi:hypothetical protein
MVGDEMIRLFCLWFGFEFELNKYELEIGIGVFLLFYLKITFDKCTTCDNFGIDKSQYSTSLYWRHGEIGVMH